MRTRLFAPAILKCFTNGYEPPYQRYDRSNPHSRRHDTRCVYKQANTRPINPIARFINWRRMLRTNPD
ncbi:MAG: hypothetical protein A3B68_02605 [Candidatus Melainabacteria bacterium RIFCSPHIGHO2_02_FULL_34_12]|nr:MAG: hypothetical protein A3B68_02605 [Candidatus Melainabacteria bacterium RIFCSPHIGHO2_02_FULL_34_12]